MDRGEIFDKNLQSLSVRDSDLCARLSGAGTAAGNSLQQNFHYQCIESASGEVVPIIVGSFGSRPLHSTVDPKREALRFVSAVAGGGESGSLEASGFLVFFGLGGGFAPAAALQTKGVYRVIVIDYDIDGIARLFRTVDFSPLLTDPRFILLADPRPGLIEKTVLELYRPALHGSLKTLPLRARVEIDKKRFESAAGEVQKAAEKTASDYSVQAYFGSRWFVNTIRNLKTAWTQAGNMPHIQEAAICAAGPSLDDQIPLLAEQKEKSNTQKLFVISTDTALPALLSGGVKPDIVVSIDCQHISYSHFMDSACRNIPLFMDISGPPVLAELSLLPFFFSGGHPLAVYISQHRQTIPLLDTSGGNVTYACLSLAEFLNAHRITVYGADFSYPGGKIYARGTYLFPLFQKKQSRFAPLESQVSSFLYRSPFLDSGRLYETAVLRFYREAFEKKAALMRAEIKAAPGKGLPLVIRKAAAPVGGKRAFDFSPGNAETTAADFLKQYRQDIAALPLPSTGSPYPDSLDAKARRIAATLLPLAASVKRRRPELNARELINEIKHYSISEIDRIIF